MRTVARMSAPLVGARHPGTQAPHVAISREERDLSHAGYRAPLLNLTRTGLPLRSFTSWDPFSVVKVFNQRRQEVATRIRSSSR